MRTFRHGVLLVVFALLLTPGAASAAGGSFVDDDDSVHEADIEALAAAGVTRGCNPPVNDRFCPDEAVTRGQMAAFLHRALPDLDLGSPVSFSDDDDSAFEADIEWLAAAGVTRGCNPPVNDRFCPDEAVTRGQMASFLVRALDLSPVEPPPAPGCENPPLVPADPNTRNVTVTGSNAYATVSTMLIDGEARRLTFVAEVVNSKTETMLLGEAEIAIYDAAGGRIGTRYAYAAADALEPGEVTVITETMPSLLYFTDETNDFPDGWASWALALEADPGVPGDYDDRVLGTKALELVEDDLGSLVATGSVVNTLMGSVGDEQAWVALSMGDDLINVAVDYLYEDLAPNDLAPFEVTFFDDEPICHTSARSGAAGK